MNDDLAKAVDAAESVCILTGAGISTESGIPDFRSPGGIWSRFRIIEYHEFVSSAEARLEDWRRRFCMEDQLGTVEPNRGHRWVAQLVRSAKCPAVITQNVDGLHQLSGVPADRVIELHGNSRHALCLDCGRRHEIAECRAMLEETDRPPACAKCGGIVKSAVVMFGQAMPQAAMEKAEQAIRACDLFIAMGTSLAVYPAATLPLYAKQAGAIMAIVNREPTGLDRFADLVVHGEIGDIVGE